MRYYGLVDKIKYEHSSGIYGRKSLLPEQITRIQNSFKNEEYKLLWLEGILGIDFFKYLILGLSPSLGLVDFVFDFIKNYLYPDIQEIKLQIENKSGSKTKSIIILNEGLENKYSIGNNKDLFYGLFDSFTNQDKAFEALMKSKGGSDLIILERDFVPKDKHYGGKYGKFSTGLYSEHPKDSNILIPLENSTELIKNFILEETLRSFELLGAKKILIEDKTEIDSIVTGKAPIDGINIDANINSSYEKEILRKKEFGKGTFDPERCKSNLLFIPDFPNIMTVIDSRIHGNQIIEEFTETINLGSNLDVNVISLYKAQLGFKYTRKWHFIVEFYDKTEK